MADTTITLIVEKGPKKGESIECSPGRRIRIGRVVKGNTFAIKDSGISERHVVFETHGDRWAVTDLDTSNGTFLNDRQIDPLAPSVLSDGDVIKIGFETSISVRISGTQTEATESKVVEEGGRRRGRSKKGGEAAVEQSAKEVKKEELPVRRTRGAARRAATEVEKEAIVTDQVQTAKNDAGVLQAGVRKRRGASRKCASDSVPEEVKPSLCDEQEKGVDVKDDSGEVRNGDLQDLDGECALGDKVPSGECSKVGSLKDGVLDGDGVAEEGKIDMENMTLGQWLDRLEICLPMMVNDAAKEIIADIREKGDQYKKLLLNASDDV